MHINAGGSEPHLLWAPSNCFQKREHTLSCTRTWRRRTLQQSQRKARSKLRMFLEDAFTYLAKETIAKVNEGVFSTVLPIQELLGEVVEFAESAKHASRARARVICIVQKLPEGIHVLRSGLGVEYVAHKELGGICGA